MWLNSIRLALRSIRRNVMRSFLTMLGIVIGVSAVITMVTIGNGATQAVRSQIESLGSNLLMVRPGQRLGPMRGPGAMGAPFFREADAEAIATQIGGVRVVAPEARSNITVIANGRNWNTSVIGSTNEYFTAANWAIARGRAFTEGEVQAGSAVCVIGETLRRELFGGGDVLGGQLRVRQFSCIVIGLLAPKGRAAMGADQDDLVLMPLRTVQRRVTGMQTFPTMLVSMEPGSDVERVKSSLTQLLRERRKLSPGDDDNFNVLDTAELAETITGTTRVMTALLGAVAAVSLLVGGIGIMNIMLVSVTERTREIGLRLAIGALEREVLLQFLIEAVVLAALGGVIGIIVATAASMALAGLSQVPYIFSPGINVLAFVFSAGIGVLFGFFPAHRAARLYVQISVVELEFCQRMTRGTHGRVREIHPELGAGEGQRCRSQERQGAAAVSAHVGDRHAAGRGELRRSGPGARMG
jgi:putative ABC transport system permease protein